MSDKTLNFLKEKLLKLYDPEATGIWQIFGEEPNVDLYGDHHQPLLETVKGTYRNVVEYAINLSEFVGWGSGGRIKKKYSSSSKSIKNIDRLSDPEIIKLENEKKVILERLKIIDKELDRIIKK